MEKYLLWKISSLRHPAVKKILMMKLLTVLSLFLFLQAQAGVFSQGTTFTITIENKEIRAVLNEIENQSEIRFFYSEEFSVLNKRISYEGKDVSIDEVLSGIFRDTDLDYRVFEDNLVVIIPAEQMIQIIVTGKVSDANRQPLPGVNVLEMGTNNGVITDHEGSYTISVSSENSVLLFSYVGYHSREIRVGSSRVLDLVLQEDIQSLEEVVVIGYGTIRKSDLTGAVSSIKSEDLPLAGNANITQMIQGKAAGVQVVQKSAQPGGGLEILVRGSASTNADNQPLYVIDGFPVYNEQLEPQEGSRYSSGDRNPLNAINPNDIESIEILKDASSTAIYGARAANGVVLITTKRGTEGVKVSYNGRYSVQKIERYAEMLNAEEFMDMYDLHRKQFILAAKDIEPYGPNPETETSYRPYFTEEVRNHVLETVGREGTDWFEEVTRTGSIVDQNLSISGGSGKTRYYSSFNYFDQSGVVINSEFQRFAGRLNVDQEITEKLAFGLSLTGSQINNLNSALGQGYWERMGVIGSALGFPPIYPVYDSLGNYSVNQLYSLNPNPVSFKEIEDLTVEKRWLGSAYFLIHLLDGLDFKTSFGFDDLSSERKSYMPNSFKFGEAEGGVATRGANGAFSYLFDLLLSYNKAFRDDHFLSAVAGYSYQRYVQEGFSTRNTNFFTDAFGANRIQAGSAEPYTTSYKTGTVMASYFARVNYSYKSRYLVTLTGRLDGSDRFGVNNKYGFFPSAAMGWNVAREDFMGSVNWLNDFKLRVSLGQTGNSSIGGNAFAYYGPNAQYQFNDIIYSGMVKTQQENPNLKWETSTEFNAGLDFGLFRNRFSGSFEIFNKRISDLLYRQTLQIYQQVGSIYMNVGETQSRGFEFTLNANILSGEFKWITTLNLSRYIDKWLERAPEAISTLDPNVAINDYLRPLYYFVPERILQIGEEAPYGRDYIPGNLVVKDLDGWMVDETGNYVLDAYGRRMKTGEPDGRINDADRKFLGTYDPKLIFGIGNTLKYKNFDLVFFFNGMLNYWVNNDHYRFHLGRTEFIYGGFNKTREFMDTWTPDHPDGSIPASVQNATQWDAGFDAYAYQEVSFIRLKNITLGYRIPVQVWGTSIRVYLDGGNLFTITNLEDMDPETITYTGESQYSNTGSGLYAYPNQRTVTFGLSVDF